MRTREKYVDRVLSSRVERWVGRETRYCNHGKSMPFNTTSLYIRGVSIKHETGCCYQLIDMHFFIENDYLVLFTCFTHVCYFDWMRTVPYPTDPNVQFQNTNAPRTLEFLWRCPIGFSPTSHCVLFQPAANILKPISGNMFFTNKLNATGALMPTWITGKTSTQRT